VTTDGVKMNENQQKRRASIAAMYQEGYTLTEVGAKFDISRERVRQILQMEGVAVRHYGSRRRELRNQELRDQKQQILEDYRELLSLVRVAAKYKTSTDSIRALLWDDLSDLEKRTARSKTTGRKYSDEQILDFLREAASATPGMLSVIKYNRYAAERGWCDSQTPTIRFGSWSKALEAAGVPSRTRQPWLGKPKYSDQQILDHMRRVRYIVGRPPTVAEYDTHRLESHPPSATIRRRFGNSWIAALQELEKA
jgi:predicted DNA-binding protein YlxM (UPF0122 family)